jgi:hypothetical protein
MITVYNNKYPTFETAAEYYHAARRYESNPKGVPVDCLGNINSPYLAYLWARFDELNLTPEDFPL